MTLIWTRNDLEAELLLTDWRLHRLVVPEATRRAEEMGWDLWGTSVIRDDSPIHRARRAFDGDLVERPGENPELTYLTAGEALTDWINSRFVYGFRGDGTPTEVAIWHNAIPEGERNSPRHGWHLHLQTPSGYMSVAGSPV